MNETAAGIAAFVGAAAWLPQIGTWVYKRLKRPTLTIMPHKSPEIGYTPLGPIFNLSLALAVDKEDTLVTRLGVILTHASGQEKVFSWQGMSETFTSLRDKLGVQQATLEKDQDAIALKVSTVGLIEKKFRFQEDRFNDAFSPMIKTANEHLRYLRESKGNEHPSAFLQSEPYHKLVSAVSELFWWQAGKYRIVFTAECSGKVKLKQAALHFSLTQAEIDDLRENLNKVTVSFENSVRIEEPEYGIKEVAYAWKYPHLESAADTPLLGEQ